MQLKIRNQIELKVTSLVKFYGLICLLVYAPLRRSQKIWDAKSTCSLTNILALIPISNNTSCLFSAGLTFPQLPFLGIFYFLFKRLHKELTNPINYVIRFI